MNIPKTVDPHLKIVFSMSFIIGINNLVQFAINEDTIDPLHLLRTQQNALSVVLAFLKLSHVLVAVTEKFLSKSLKVRIFVVSSLYWFQM
jgi:hypothetical protein